LGADKAIYVNTDLKHDTALQPIIVAQTLKHFVQQEKIDLVILGKQSVDDDCNQTGQILAGLLGWPQATFASKIDINGNEIEVTREVDTGLETIKIKSPAVITCDLRLNVPKIASLPQMMKAKKANI
jgi:electron transfer flavoprotein beta subunit